MRLIGMMVVSGAILVGGAACGAFEEAPPVASSIPAGLPKSFDPARDPARDLQAAVVLAGQGNKRIILDVGGEWCSWCHTLDRFIEEHETVKTAITRDFVWVKINFSEGHENKAFLSRYPVIAGYPHLFVLERDGTLLHSQDTALLEDGRSYNLERLEAFLSTWAPGGSARSGA
jgi:thiol:disulfide interchange protein